jgi:hypothetical protein
MPTRKPAPLTVGKLTTKLQKIFNTYIRKRDEGLGCISCGSHNQIQAGHFYSAGHHPALRFNEDNTHSQCLRCNYFLSANLLEYRKRLLKKIGEERVAKLDLIAAIRRVTRYSSRFELELLIKFYQDKLKQLK